MRATPARLFLPSLHALAKIVARHCLLGPCHDTPRYCDDVVDFADPEPSPLEGGVRRAVRRGLSAGSLAPTDSLDRGTMSFVRWRYDRGGSAPYGLSWQLSISMLSRVSRGVGWRRRTYASIPG